jgi:hypothetical protein
LPPADRGRHRAGEGLHVGDGERHAVGADLGELGPQHRRIGDRFAGQPLEVAAQIRVDEVGVLVGEEDLALRAAMEREVVAVVGLGDVLGEPLRRVDGDGEVADPLGDLDDDALRFLDLGEVGHRRAEHRGWEIGRADKAEARADLVLVCCRGGGSRPSSWMTVRWTVAQAGRGRGSRRPRGRG